MFPCSLVLNGSQLLFFWRLTYLCLIRNTRGQFSFETDDNIFDLDAYNFQSFFLGGWNIRMNLEKDLWMNVGEDIWMNVGKHTTWDRILLSDRGQFSSPRLILYSFFNVTNVVAYMETSFWINSKFDWSIKKFEANKFQTRIMNCHCGQWKVKLQCWFLGKELSRALWTDPPASRLMPGVPRWDNSQLTLNCSGSIIHNFNLSMIEINIVITRWTAGTWTRRRGWSTGRIATRSFQGSSLAMASVSRM